MSLSVAVWKVLAGDTSQITSFKSVKGSYWNAAEISIESEATGKEKFQILFNNISNYRVFTTSYLAFEYKEKAVYIHWNMYESDEDRCERTPDKQPHFSVEIDYDNNVDALVLTSYQARRIVEFLEVHLVKLFDE